MAGFDWNQFHAIFKAKMGSDCTVGRYTIPKTPKYPYLDISLADNSGMAYDLENNENAQNPMIEINVYCNNYADEKCYEISMKAKELMLAYGFQCKTGPIKTTSSDPSVARWVARYQRKYANEDEIRKLK